MNSMDLIEDSPIDIIGKNMRNAYFDEIIGHIEDIVLSDEFVELHTDFLEKNWQTFEDVEENRLEYMNVFLEYVNIFENFLVEQLHQRMEYFDMQVFAAELSKDIEFKSESNFDEIYELLHSFNSFEAFKELMLDYRRSKERKLQNLDFDSILITQPMQIMEESNFCEYEYKTNM